MNPTSTKYALSGEIPHDPGLVFHRGGEHLLEGALQLLDHIELLNLPFHQSGVAHQVSDDPIRALHLLADDLDLLGDRLAFLDRALQGVGGIVDDRQWVLKLMGNLGGQAPGRLELLAPQRQFTVLFLPPTLAFEEELQAPGPGRHRQQ